MPKLKKNKKNATKVPMGMVDEKIENVIGKLFVTSFTRIHQIIKEDVVKMFEEEYKWADELLEEVKREFSSPVSKIKLLPKTPSAKRKRGRIRKETVIEEAEEKDTSEDPTESVPIACDTDANILAYETPPQRAYRTRAASRTAQTKRVTRNTAAKKQAKYSESEDLINEVQSSEDKKTPVLNFNSSTKCDNLTPNILLKGGTSKSQNSESHVFSPPVGKPGKGHVKNKVHAYEEYIEQNSPSLRHGQAVNQSSVPETPEQTETMSNSEETCLETPEAVSLGKRLSVHKPLMSTSASRKSLLKSSKIHMNPKLLHTAENKETPGKKNKLKLKKKTQKDKQDDEGTSHSEKDTVESLAHENSNERKLESEKENSAVNCVESVQTAMNTDNEPENQVESKHEQEMKESIHEQVQVDEPMESREVIQEPNEKENEQLAGEEEDVSMHSTAEEPLSSSHQESEKVGEEKGDQEEDICMEECENVPSVDIKESESTKDQQQVVENVENKESERKNLSSDANGGESDDDEVMLLSKDEECKTSAESKQKTDSVTQADDESEETEEEKQPPRASKRTKQRNQPKTQVKSESDSETDTLPPKRTRTKTRKVLENESMEVAKPVRQSTRTKQRKQDGASVSSAAGSDTTSEVDSGHGSLTSGSRTTRSKMRKPKESSVNSDADAHFAVPENPAPRARTTSRKRTLDTDGEDEINSSLSKKTKRESGESSEVTSDAKSRSARKGTDTDDERSSQSEDETPDTVRAQAKIVKPVSFLNNLNNKVVRPAGLNFSGVKSFLHQNTPPNKLTVKEQQEQRKRELEEKKKKEAERLQKRELEKKKKIEELRKKREERMRRVNERREQANREEMESKNRIMKTLEEKSKQADDLKEEKMKEEQERQKMRLKKQEEAEERRRQEEEERARKLKEQEEMEQRNIEFMQRKKEHEEQERLRKKAEERRKFEERMAEFERERIAEHERLKKIEEEKIRERQKLREERERQLAKERAERDRLDTEKRKQKELELKQKMEKIKELEKKRLIEEEKRRQELKERERAINAIVNKHNMYAQSVPVTSVISGMPKPNLNSTLTVEQPINSQEKMPNPDSYEMTPAKKFLPQKVSLESYDISDLRSDDSTDEDDAPRKRVPNWALGASLKAALIQQHYHPPDLNLLFTEIVPPDLNELFVKKKARFNKRTSSAIWTSPILKPGMNH
ncbi:inner centromere protein A-like [Saccostrea echinata]|uniref:inner centromere protein A-like n=1 Tax=Saccostrea echinata TaxID=191078 RepID=UPI002A7FD743|nr:inner centromere protein A-like [Saccostrea echinata]